MSPRKTASLAGLAGMSVMLTTACVVQSEYGRCISDEDCPSEAICETQTGMCQVQCQSDRDCLVQGKPVGKKCLNNRCVFELSQRVAAPVFCLDVVNPKSVHYKKNLCTTDLLGKAFYIYFGLLG